MSDSKSLQKKTISGLFWSFSEVIMNQGIQLAIQFILAWLIVPEDFGVIAMITVFIAISTSIIDSGFSNALIREKEVAQKEYSTVFFFNLITSIILCLILVFSAPAIGRFYGQEKLPMVLRVLSVTLIINSFGLMQKTMLSRKLDFKTQTKISVIASVTSGIVGVIAAFMGFGIWSLVIRTLLLSIIQSTLLCLFNKWKPSFVFDIESFRKFFKFGWKLMVSGLINTIYEQLYTLIIGKRFLASDLGYYANASKLRDTVSQSITMAIQKVSYPVLSNIQGGDEKLKAGYKKIIKNAAFIIFPIMVGLGAIANTLIPALLGPKWEPSIVYLQMLCIAGMLYPIHAINLNILQVKGRSDLFLKLEIIKKVICIVMIAVVLGLKMNILALMWVAIITSFISYFINAYYSKDLINYSTKEQLMDLIPTFTITIVMGAIVYTIGAVIPLNIYILMIVQLIVGVTSYLIMCKIIKIQELENILGLVKGFLKK